MAHAPKTVPFFRGEAETKRGEAARTAGTWSLSPSWVYRAVDGTTSTQQPARYYGADP
jgi:hypothetical protein